MGRAFRATADDPQTAQLMGINHKHIYGVAMAIAFATVATRRRVPRGPHDLRTQSTARVSCSSGSRPWSSVGWARCGARCSAAIVLGVSQTVGNQAAVGWDILRRPLVFLAVLAFRPHGLLGTGVQAT